MDLDSRAPVTRQRQVVIVLLVLHLVVGIARRCRRPAARRRLRATAVRPRRHPVRWRRPSGSSPCSRASSTARCSPATSSWIPQLGLDLDLRLDGFAALMLVLVAGIGVLVVAYSARYFAHPTPAHGRLLGLLVLFAGAMVGPRPRRQPARAVRVLGADVGHVVPAHRPRPRGSQGPRRRPAGPAGHRRRRAGDARRLHRPRPGRRHVPAQRHPRRPARRRRG